MTDLPSGPFPFAFIGAGEASYFEWAEVHVRFGRAPTSIEQQAIALRVPAPLRDSIEWDGPQLMVASDQFAHAHIAEAYPDPDAVAGGAGEKQDDLEGDEGTEDDDEDEGEGRFFFASAAQVHRFNQDTQDWLLFAHAVCPILCAYRGEDLESGGTELSPWHSWSIQQLPSLLPALEEVARVADGESHASAMVRGVLSSACDAGVELPEQLLEWLQPGRREAAALQRGDGDELARLIGAPELSPSNLEALAGAVDGSVPEQAAALLRAAGALLARADLPAPLLVELVVAAASTPEEAAARPEIFDASRSRAASDTDLTDRLGYAGYKLAREGRFGEALAVFDVAVEGEGQDLSTYCNALWAVMADNNHLPVQTERAGRYLSACLRHGPQNPAIYYNAACVCSELGDVEQLLADLRLAREHGYARPEVMRDEPLFQSLRGDARFQEIFADLETPPAEVAAETSRPEPKRARATKRGRAAASNKSGRASKKAAPKKRKTAPKAKEKTARAARPRAAVARKKAAAATTTKKKKNKKPVPAKKKQPARPAKKAKAKARRKRS